MLPNFKSPNSFTYVRRPPSECPKRINGVESLSRSESSNLDFCDIWASQERYMLFSLYDAIYELSVYITTFDLASHLTIKSRYLTLHVI